MKKRILSLFLVIFLLFSLIPAVRAEDPAEKKAPASIKDQVLAFTKSIDQADAETSAASTLALHGFTGGGKTLKMDETSALTTVIFNAGQFQYWLAEGCAKAIENMYQLDIDSFDNLYGSCNWTSDTNQVRLYTRQHPYPGNVDWYLLSTAYEDNWNSYDRALEWMVSSNAIRLNITRTEVREDTAVYQVEVLIWDIFDFSLASSNNYKKFLSGIGMLMFKEYRWECSASFTLEVPYTCSHDTGAYRWVYDAETGEMTSVVRDGFLENSAERRVNKGERDYYALEKTVRLFHDKPWVIEYDVQRAKRVYLAPVEQTAYCSLLSLFHVSSYVQFMNKTYEILEVHPNGSATQTYTHHKIKAIFSTLDVKPGKKLLTYRLENTVYPDGSNMVFLTILDPATGQILAERVPMDDHYVRPKGESADTLVSEECDLLSGRDMYINFIGSYTASYYFNAEYFDLRIWENGVDGGVGSLYADAGSVAPTCTEDGYTQKVCAACGHTIRESIVPATGHRYTPTVTAPTCTKPGHTTYTCACGDTFISDQVEAPGHDWTDWQTMVEAACTESGLEERWCNRCAERQSRVTDPLGHRYTAEVIEPGCLVGGYTLHTCICGDSYQSDFTNPRGHRYTAVVTAPGCTTGGYTTYTCDCGDTYRTDFTSPTGHRYEAAETAPGCTTGGYTTYTCACGDRYTTNYVNPLGHDMGKWQTAQAPTCTEHGTESRSCSRCAYSESRTVNALGHTFAEGICHRCGAEDPNYEEPVVNPFVDVPDNSFYFEPVLWALENGITTGATEITFNPNGSCMRAHVVTFLHRAAGNPEPIRASNPFTDVKTSDFFYKPVLWAVENGITNGISGTHFGSFDNCNRAAVVTFLWRAAGQPEPTHAENPFEDVKSTDFFCKAVLWAVENGITNGIDRTHFGPTTECNRAQVVTFLYRAYN